jgi:hypothetical protein
VYRADGPGGTATIKVVRDSKGFFVDATALELYFLRWMYNEDDGETETCDFHIPIKGVLWPTITEDFCFKFDDIEKYNSQQLDTNQRFAAYFEEKYGCPYVFAFQEYWQSYEASTKLS